MLELKHINKKYNNELVLKDINIIFREKEFVSILGESGSGKSTLLNILSGLDKPTSGELLINGINTKKYKDKDFDNYRNKIGFVFQNYNLINHLNIYDNIAISINNSNNRLVLEALEKVGLLKYKNKYPLELSGGERQRVAIARAIVKNPDILFLDEPTGALDSKTGIEIMNIIKTISKNKLVIMVTHNKELAYSYSNRILNLKDGIIIKDSNICKNNQNKKTIKYKNTKMKLTTALKITLNNMKYQKKRTILVSLASSIGIIGISLILALSNGVQLYINKEQQNTFANYPIEINKTNLDYSNVVLKDTFVKCNKNTICSKDDISNSDEVIDKLSLKENNLKEFKKYLDSNKKINNYSNSIEYKYDIDLLIYSKNNNKVTNNIKTNNNLLGTSNNLFIELVNDKNIRKNKYKIISGKMAKSFNELVIVVNKDNVINMSTLYNLDIESIEELNNKISHSSNNLVLKSKTYNYQDLIGLNYKLVLNSDLYQKENNKWIDKSTDKEYLNRIINNGIDLTIVGIIKEVDENSNSYVGYNHELIEYIINKNKDSLIYKELLNNNSLNEDYIKKLGIADINNPVSINIYPNSYENKEKINKYIEEYNNKVDKNNKISYTDLVGILLSGISSIVRIISYILIALVAISLIVSSIMISIITYISVLERIKEIGILRSIGYSRQDIKRLFKLEKIIEGLIAGIIGILLSRLLIIPVNILIERFTKVSSIAIISFKNTIYLLLISILITIISGLKPAKKASKLEIVDAIRNE